MVPAKNNYAESDLEPVEERHPNESRFGKVKDGLHHHLAHLKGSLVRLKQSAIYSGQKKKDSDVEKTINELKVVSAQAELLKHKESLGEAHNDLKKTDCEVKKPVAPVTPDQVTQKPTEPVEEEIGESEESRMSRAKAELLKHKERLKAAHEKLKKAGKGSGKGKP